MAMRSDNPEFIGKYIPGILEKNDAKLAKTPDDQALILETGSLYVMYANAFEQGPAEMLPAEEFDRREEALAQAKADYLRGAELLNHGVALKFPGFAEAYANNDPDGVAAAIASATAEDAAYFYWAAAASLSAYSLDPFNLDLGMKISSLKAMVDKAYQVSPDFNSGAIDDFYVLFYSSVPAGIGGDMSKVEGHYRLAVEKSGGLQAGPYVSYAQSVAIPLQDRALFMNNIEQALAIDPDADKDNRLVNTINQRKAQYLLDNVDNLFVGEGDDEWDDEWIDGEEPYPDDADEDGGEPSGSPD
jgi:predicted anti-sigma-YlaC factor YlaD